MSASPGADRPPSAPATGTAPPGRPAGAASVGLRADSSSAGSNSGADVRHPNRAQRRITARTRSQPHPIPEAYCLSLPCDRGATARAPGRRSPCPDPAADSAGPRRARHWPTAPLRGGSTWFRLPLPTEIDGAPQPPFRLIEVTAAVVHPTQGIEIGGVVRVEGHGTRDQIQGLVEKDRHGPPTYSRDSWPHWRRPGPTPPDSRNTPRMPRSPRGARERRRG